MLWVEYGSRLLGIYRGRKWGVVGELESTVSFEQFISFAC